MAKKVRWGVKSGLVGSGAFMIILAGIPALILLFVLHVAYIWLFAISFVGLLTMIVGLMGEQGVW